jgi:ABC-type multidrug transport system permease subunit
MRSPLAHLVLARLRESFRQPETIFWTFLFPALLAVALGVAFREGPPDPSTVMVVAKPGPRYIDFLIPGLLGMNLMGGGLWGIGWSIVEMRIRKLLKLQLAAPMRRRDFLLSHILSRMVFVPLEVVPLLALAGVLFHVSVRGPIVSLAVVVTAGAFSFAGLGTLLAARARTTQMIYGLINLCTLPMFVLSGVFFSTGRFPDALQPLIRALPLTALIDALRAVINDGASILRLGPQFLVLGLWGVLSFAGTRWLFRWS